MAEVDISGGGGETRAQGRQTEAEDSPESLARLFPMGSAALFKMQGRQKVSMGPEERITIVNVSLAGLQVSVPNEAIKPTKGVVEKRVRVKPFGRIEMPVAYARRFFTTQEKPMVPRQGMVAPIDGDCEGASFTDRRSGRTFRTCPYAKCKTHGALPTSPIPCYWSIWQVQHCLSQLQSAEAIQRVIETIDTRQEVMLWGLHIMNQRAQTLAIRTGRIGTVNLADSNVVL